MLCVKARDRVTRYMYYITHRHSGSKGFVAKNVAALEKFLSALEQGTRKRESAR